MNEGRYIYLTPTFGQTYKPCPLSKGKFVVKNENTDHQTPAVRAYGQ